MLEDATAVVRLPQRVVQANTLEREVFHGILLSLNLIWFLAYQMEFMMLIMVAVITTLH